MPKQRRLTAAAASKHLLAPRVGMKRVKAAAFDAFCPCFPPFSSHAYVVTLYYIGESPIFGRMHLYVHT